MTLDIGFENNLKNVTVEKFENEKKMTPRYKSMPRQ